MGVRLASIVCVWVCGCVDVRTVVDVHRSQFLAFFTWCVCVCVWARAREFGERSAVKKKTGKHLLGVFCFERRTALWRSSGKA
jgi:hypothetical protein